MREYQIRLTVRTNDLEPDHPAYGERPYRDDGEMGRVLLEWFHDALVDRDDSPHIVWGEATLREDPRRTLDQVKQDRPGVDWTEAGP